MQTPILLTAPAIARAAGCSVTTVLRRVSTGVAVPDAWVETGSGRQPVFRADRLDDLKSAAMPQQILRVGKSGFMTAPVACAQNLNKPAA